MGWVWKEDDDDVSLSSGGDITGSSSNAKERCSTRKIVKSQCRTEEVEPGKFVRKCEKTEQLLRECAGRPAEVVQSNKEYTEDDVTDEVLNGRSFSHGSTEIKSFDFPGLRSDIESLERNFFGNIDRFFEAAEDMKNSFFGAFGAPGFYSEESSPPSIRRGIPIESHPEREAPPKRRDSPPGGVDIDGLARDV